MKKRFIPLFLIAVVATAAAKAQTIQDGIMEIYADRLVSAKAIFQKMIDAKRSNDQAWYWLGQTYLVLDDVENAQSTYTKGFAENPKSQLLIVGLGEMDIISKKPGDAKQKFEAAITESHTKKGDDPNILYAIGRAIANNYSIKEKVGDIDYAVQKLEAATARDPQNPYILIMLADAYLKAKPGENGSLAVQTLNKANAVVSALGIPNFKLAQIYKTQKNWDVYEGQLDRAIVANNHFAPAYYDYWAHYLLTQQFNKAEKYADLYLEHAEKDPQNEYIRAQTLFVNKKYDEAIASAQKIRTEMNGKVKPNVNKLLAHAYVAMGDTIKAKPFIDEYFAKQKKDDFWPKDYVLKADVYSAIPGQDDVVYQSIIEGVEIDTTLDGKLDVLKGGATLFKARKKFDKEAKIWEMILKLKKEPNLNDHFATAMAYYSAKDYPTARNRFATVAEKYPDEVYGHYYKYVSSSMIDTAKQDSILVPDALSLLAFCDKDTAKYVTQISSVTSLLAKYYYEKKQDYETSANYFRRYIYYCPAEQKEAVQGYIDQLSAVAEQIKKQKSSQGAPPPPSGGVKKGGSANNKK